MKLEDRCNNCEYMKTSWGEKPCFGCIFNQQTNHSNNFKKIKDEPMRAEEWAEENYTDFNSLHGCIDYGTRAFQAGAAENEKKHRATQTWKEWLVDRQIRIGQTPESYVEEIWNACKAAHNLPEEK